MYPRPWKLPELSYKARVRRNKIVIWVAILLLTFGYLHLRRWLGM